MCWITSAALGLYAGSPACLFNSLSEGTGNDRPQAHCWIVPAALAETQNSRPHSQGRRKSTTPIIAVVRGGFKFLAVFSPFCGH